MSRSKVPKARLEDYLTTVYRLEEALGFARTTDISRELKVSPATVSKVMRKLEDKNYVKREKYRYVKLTSVGKKIAEQIIRKHRIAEVFLSKILGFNELESHLYAHHLEHLPDIIIEKMFIVAGKPAFCPHGNNIPGEESEAEELASLNSVQKEQVCVVKRIAGEFLDILEHLYNISVQMYSTVKVIRYTSKGVLIELKNKQQIEIPSHIARFIYVKC